MCCERNWSGFKASWLDGDSKGVEASNDQARETARAMLFGGVQMQQSDYDDFTNIIQVVGEQYGKKLSGGVIALYWQGFARLRACCCARCSKQAFA